MGSGEQFFICSIYLSNVITTLILYFSQLVIDFSLYTEFLLLLMVCLDKWVFLLCFLSWCYITNRLHKVKSIMSRKCYCRIIWVCSMCIWLLHLKTVCRKHTVFNIHFLIHFLSNKTSLQKLLKALKLFRFPEKITYPHKFMLVCTQLCFPKHNCTCLVFWVHFTKCNFIKCSDSNTTYVLALICCSARWGHCSLRLPNKNSISFEFTHAQK